MENKKKKNKIKIWIVQQFFVCLPSWDAHNAAAYPLNGESMFGSPNNAWIDNKIVLTL